MRREDKLGAAARIHQGRGAALALAMTFLVAAPSPAQEEPDNAPAADAAAHPAAPDPGPIPSLPAAKATHARLLDIAVAGTRIVAVGEEGVILGSDDGKTWTQVPSPAGVMLTRLRFVDDRHGWALGYDATILETTDAGRTWALRHRDAAARALFDVLFLDAKHGIAVGAYGSHVETLDGGQTWAPRGSILADAGMHLNTLLRLGGGMLLVVGERGFMARSADAGETWAVLDSPYAGSLFGALPRGDQGAIVYGMRGHAYEAADVSTCPTIPAESWDAYSRTTVDDAARIATLGWRLIANDSKESLFGALPAADGSALLVGANATVLRLDRDAKALTPVKAAANETLVKLARYDGHTYAVGRRGLFLLDAGAAR